MSSGPFFDPRLSGFVAALLLIGLCGAVLVGAVRALFRSAGRGAITPLLAFFGIAAALFFFIAVPYVYVARQGNAVNRPIIGWESQPILPPHSEAPVTVAPPYPQPEHVTRPMEHPIPAEHPTAEAARAAIAAAGAAAADAIARAADPSPGPTPSPAEVPPTDASSKSNPPPAKPADGFIPLAEEPAPNWILAPSDIDNQGVYRETLSTDRHASQRECETDLDIRLEAAVRELVRNDLGPAAAAEIHFAPGFIRRSYVEALHWERSNLNLESSVVPMYRLYARLKIDRKARDSFAQLTQEMAKDRRLVETGTLSALVLGLLGLVYGVLKLTGKKPTPDPSHSSGQPAAV